MNFDLDKLISSSEYKYFSSNILNQKHKNDTKKNSSAAFVIPDLGPGTLI